jgi:hypothetical protein
MLFPNDKNKRIHGGKKLRGEIILLVFVLLATALIPLGVHGDNMQMTPSDAPSLAATQEDEGNSPDSSQAGDAGGDAANVPDTDAEPQKNGVVTDAMAGGDNVDTGAAIDQPDGDIKGSAKDDAKDSAKDDTKDKPKEEEKTPVFNAGASKIRSFKSGAVFSRALTQDIRNSSFTYNTATPDPNVGNASDYPKYPAPGSVEMTKGAQWDDEGNSDDMTILFDMVGKSRQEGADVILAIDRSSSMFVDENGNTAVNINVTGSSD